MDSDVMVGGVKSATTGGVHAVTVATPPVMETAPAAGQRLTSNFTGHAPVPDRHVVVVRKTRFQLMVAPSLKPAAVTVRVTVRRESATVLPPGVMLSVAVTPVLAPATVAAATDSDVAESSTTLKTWLGPEMTSLRPLPEFVTQLRMYPAPSMSSKKPLDGFDWIVTVLPSAKTLRTTPPACSFPVTSDTGPNVRLSVPSVAGIVVPTTSS
mmetsp:Transcript_4688/g.11634  ORF Transcript_4688/g.11634 Transcript_4688/m.11634 type:complete len:211 (+) Transcript_4688:259-891(+)